MTSGGGPQKTPMSRAYAAAFDLLAAQGDDAAPSPAATPRTASHDETWLDVRVFVSSTFVDMREERLQQAKVECC